jgi:hypothetical protein
MKSLSVAYAVCKLNLKVNNGRISTVGRPGQNLETQIESPAGRGQVAEARAARGPEFKPQDRQN